MLVCLCQLFTMLKDWPRLSPEESAALRYIPANMSAWQTVRPGWLGAMGQWSSYALRVPSCAHMELLFLRNVHLRLAVSSVPAESRWLFTGWATVSTRSLIQRRGICRPRSGSVIASVCIVLAVSLLSVPPPDSVAVHYLCFPPEHLDLHGTACAMVCALSLRQ